MLWIFKWNQLNITRSLGCQGKTLPAYSSTTFHSLTRYMHVQCASHGARGKFDQTKWPSSKRCRDEACETVLSSAYPVHGSASKVNCSGADAQVVSCHRYLVVFHPFVGQSKHLDSFWCRLLSTTSTSITMVSWAACAKAVRKTHIFQS